MKRLEVALELIERAADLHEPKEEGGVMSNESHRWPLVSEPPQELPPNIVLCGCGDWVDRDEAFWKDGKPYCWICSVDLPEDD